MCPKCGTGNTSDSTYCQECGETLKPGKKVEETPIKNETSFLRKIPGFRSWTPWKMFLSSIIYLIILIMIVTFASGAVSTLTTNSTTVKNNITYDANNISFIYPSDWSVDNLTSNEISNGEIISVGTGTNTITTTTTTTTSNSTNSSNTSTSKTDNCFFVSRNTSTIGVDEMNAEISAIVADPTNNQYLTTTSSAKNVTANKIIVDGVNASEIISTSIDDQGAIWKEIDIDFLKKGYIYTLTFQSTPPENFNETDYQMIINNFHVE